MHIRHIQMSRVKKIAEWCLLHVDVWCVTAFNLYEIWCFFSSCHIGNLLELILETWSCLKNREIYVGFFSQSLRLNGSKNEFSILYAWANLNRRLQNMPSIITRRENIRWPFLTIESDWHSSFRVNSHRWKEVIFLIKSPGNVFAFLNWMSL